MNLPTKVQTPKLLARIRWKKRLDSSQKSMTLQRLATRSRYSLTGCRWLLNKRGDFATTPPYKLPKADTVEELLAIHDNAVAAALRIYCSSSSRKR